MAKEIQGIPNPRTNNKENKARREKEQKQTKILRITGIVIGIVLVLLLAGGAIYEYVYKPRKTLASVGDKKVNVTQFQEAVRYQRSGLISNYNYMKSMYKMFGMEMQDSDIASYETQLSPDYKGLLGQSVLSSMVDQLLLDKGAAALGISVSDEEVEAKLRDLWGFYPDGTPTPAPTEEPFAATPTVSEAQLDILRYTQTPTTGPTETAESALEGETGPTAAEGTATVENEVETVEETAETDSEGTVIEPAEEMVEESVEETAVEDTTATEAPTAAATETTIPEPTMTPTTYTEEMYKANQTTYFANSSQYYSEEFFKKEVYYELLQTKVQDYLSKDIVREADMVWARHILVATEEEANKVIERLAAGEEWGDLAAELSTDESNKNNGGDLGWFTKESMVAEFADAAFSQEIGTISEKPVQSSYGYHIIQVVDHATHPLTSSQYQQAVSQVYQDWLDKLGEENDVSTSTDFIEYTPEEPAFER